MGAWWETDMVDAGQSMYVDPQLATELATTPDRLLMNEQQAQQQMKLAQEQKAGFWQNALTSAKDLLGKTDSTMSHVPGWGMFKHYLEASWYPIDKLAQGSRWLYSEAVSQPFSTLLLQAAKDDMDVGSFWSGSDWAESYRMANNISPGQAFMNAEMTAAASEDFGALSILSDNVEAPDMASRISGNNWKYTGPLSKEEQEQVKRQKERFLYDTQYWKDHDGETYNRGSGAVDFMYVVFGDPLAMATGGAANTIKAARSAQFVDDGLGLVRTRGNFLDTASRVLPGSKGAPQTAEEFFTQDKNMNHFYDWVASASASGAERKTASEIASHPIWGRGRRQNPAKEQLSEALAKMPRDDMNLVLRFSAGDNAAASQLVAKGTQTLDTVGRLTENRVMLQSVRGDDEFLSYFAAKEDAYPATPVPHTGTELFEPPVPRPGPGATEAQKRGWELRWGPLQARAELGQQQAAAIRGGLTGGVRPIGPVGGINADDVAAAQRWRAAQIKLVDDELSLATKDDAVFASLLGRTGENFEPGASNAFGTMERAYRMGGLGLTSTERAAEKKFAAKMTDRKGRFASQGYRNGFYSTPTRWVQSFGDRVPEGRIDHNADDANDRLLDMLKQVPALGSEQRASMLDRYITAGDKVAKSKMLQEINTEIVHHIAGRVHGLDPEVAQILNEVTKVGIDSTLNKLTKGSYTPTSQAFSGARREGGRTVDHFEDGEGWVIGPMAKTQLQSTDTLLPIQELNRVIARSSGALKTIRNAGGTANDAVKLISDSLNSTWKAATLLRPGYVPRMISEEFMASAIKFGFMSRLLADGSKGMQNFINNRAVHVAAITGHGSYVPSTGKGLASKRAVVSLEDESIGENILKHKADLARKIPQETDPYLKAQMQAEHDAISVNKIRVNSALPVVETRISMERELQDNLKRDVENWKTQIEGLKVSSLETDQLKAEALRMKIANAEDDIVDHEIVMSEFQDYADEILRVAVDSVGKRLGEGTFKVGDREIPQAFSKDWENPIPREQLSGQKAFQSLYARGEGVDVGRAIKTGNWTYISPDKPEHMDSWLRALNFQFRQDDLFRLVAEDSSGRKAINWLKTPAGRDHIKDLGPRARNGQQLVEDIKFTLDKYLPVASLQQKLAKGEQLTRAELMANISKGDFPIVHGEEIKYLTRMFAKDAKESVVDRIVAAGFNRIGTIPSDVLSRNPVYSRFFEARMRTIIGQDAAFKKSVGRDASFTSKELETMKEKADKLARKDISQIVYDPQRTTGGEALRFIFPFFNAHADSLARWGGLLGEKPQNFTKLTKLYNAPVAANMVTDQYGNVLDPDGTVTIKDPITGQFKEKHAVHIEDRVLRLRLPWKVKDEGSIPMKLSAINTILPGDPWFHPGSGPLVQIPASQVAKAAPTAGDFLQWAKILPYGPQDASTAITPKYMRTIYDRFKAGDPDGAAYQETFLAAYNKRVADHHATGAKFTIQDVEEDARKFMNLEILTAWASPVQTQVSPLTGSPYQFFVDEYKKMQEVYGPDARDTFLEKYGSDYYHFTASMTKSMGIAATRSADATAQEYKDLLDKDPEMAPFIIGNVYNGGPFNTTVYKKQLEESFGGEWVREKITAKNAIEANQIDQGWGEWQATKLELDATLIRAGFTSYSQSGAEAFAAARENVISSISALYPAWGEEFTVADRGKVPQRISAFERLTRDERLLTDPNRSEVKVLRYYLDRRKLYQQALRARGAKQLSFNTADEAIGENADIAQAWDYEVTAMLNSNIAFNQLYNRYLSGDRLQGGSDG